MGGKLLGWFIRATPWVVAAAMAWIALPTDTKVFADQSSPPVGEQNQTEQDRCKFIMEKVSAIILSLDPEGKVAFLNHYGRNFFGYSEDEILGRAMLGTLTPPTGFEGRDMASFLAAMLHDPNKFAFSVNVNRLRSGERVWIFWSNKGIYDDQGQVREVLRVGLDITERKLRLEAAAQELRDIGAMLEGRSWIQRKKLKEITARIEAISEELERPWMESKEGDSESVAPPQQ